MDDKYLLARVVRTGSYRGRYNWKKSTGSNPADNKLLKHQLSNAHKTAIGIASQSTLLRDSDASSVLGLLVNASDEQKKEI